MEGDIEPTSLSVFARIDGLPTRSIALLRPRISPLVAVLAAILLVLIVPPALFLLDVSLHETRPDGSFGAFTLRFYRGLFAERLFL